MVTRHVPLVALLFHPCEICIVTSIRESIVTGDVRYERLFHRYICIGYAVTTKANPGRVPNQSTLSAARSTLERR